MKSDNTSYRYRLEHCIGDHRKSICPNCGKRTFVKYIDVETGEPLADDIGRCDREINCGYHKKPKDYFAEGGDRPEKRYWFPKKEYTSQASTQGFSTLDPALVEDSMGLCTFNSFNVWLREHFRCKEVMDATLRYRVGGHRLWPNATVFWQIDEQQRVRAGKIMLYDHHTGHRVKDGYNHVAWVHSLPGHDDFRLRQCLFGLHLLTDDTKTICIVEAEKTAVIASMFFPDALFLATGGLTNLRPETCEPLRGRNVILFPDLGAEEIWTEKARTIPALANCRVSTWLSDHATDEMRAKGLDIADVLEYWNPEEKLRVEDFL